jgi:nucleotide-binding universal stress UspA family protein
MHYPGLLLRERDAGLKVLEEAERRVTRLPVPDLRLALGDPARVLRRFAVRERAELIVVGSRGRGAIRVALFGSVAGALAASAPVPVLVVPSSAGAGERLDAPAAEGQASSA